MPVTAVILAGGQGTRLRPFTIHRPKPLMPVANKPVIDYAIDLLELSGVVEKVYVLLDYLGQMLAEHIKRIPHAIEVEPLVFKALDTADSVRRIRHLLDDDFIVLMGDIITNCDMAEFWNTHKRKKGVATVALRSVDSPCHYGLAFVSSRDAISCFVEKPRSLELYIASIALSALHARYNYTNLANMGIYAISYELLDVLDENPHLLDFGRHVFPYLIEEGYTVYGWIADHHYWIDMGLPSTYFQANMDVLEGLAFPLQPPGINNRGIWLEAVKDIRGIIKPPAALGADVVIEADAVVGPYAIIGNGSTVGEKAVVANSVVMEKVEIGENSTISDSIIGSSVRIEGGSCVNRSIVEDGVLLHSRANVFGQIIKREIHRRVADIELGASVGGGTDTRNS
ncbi:MAG: NDP-sugar synthase [Thermofilaceae archaeon]|nr:NDP-sugar synthase [Thermofilaceae archaeon]